MMDGPSPNPAPNSAPETPPPANPPAPRPLPKPPRWKWPRLWENALAFVLGACAILVGQSAWRHWRAPEPLAVAPGGIDLNTADIGTLRQLPGVGPHLAARIVDHR